MKIKKRVSELAIEFNKNVIEENSVVEFSTEDLSEYNYNSFYDLYLIDLFFYYLLYEVTTILAILKLESTEDLECLVGLWFLK